MKRERDPREYLDHITKAISHILSRIWEIASVRVPELTPHIERMLADLSPERPHS